MEKAALISVSNKDGLIEFARGLKDLGYTLLTTRGSGSYLNEAGIETLSIEKYTGQDEILGGRVKTLHPKIHAGLLADRSKSEHLDQLKTNDILSIDVAVINLYPFIETLSSSDASNPIAMIEKVDIGGPTMIRAAAKNFRYIYPVIDPEDYPEVLATIQDSKMAEQQSLEIRRKLACKVFTQLANYNLEIATYFSEVSFTGSEPEVPTKPASELRKLASKSGVVLSKYQSLRYGENPQQKGAFYSIEGDTPSSWKQFQGKELSYNNFLDFDAAARIVALLPDIKPSVAIIKHLNPCGVALADSAVHALKLAKTSDPRSHFGGIIACNKDVDAEFATAVIEDFTEIVIAPRFSKDALEVFSRRKNIRVIEMDFTNLPLVEMRSVAGGVLIQESDLNVCPVVEMESATPRKASEREFQDLELAWRICSNVKSNAIVLVKDGVLIAAGAGQMSRIDALEVALMKAGMHGHDTSGAVCASDAFFPFSDCVERLAEVGVKAVVSPSGAQRDSEIAEVAATSGMSLLFAPERHFRH